MGANWSPCPQGRAFVWRTGVEEEEDEEEEEEEEQEEGEVGEEEEEEDQATATAATTKQQARKHTRRRQVTTNPPVRLRGRCPAVSPLLPPAPSEVTAIGCALPKTFQDQAFFRITLAYLF